MPNQQSKTDGLEAAALYPLVRERRDRSKYTREDALHEIEMAEVILDGCGATRGKTLWGRIASLKGNLSNEKAQPRGN